MKKYDVIVIGAGFAGPVAAKKCADAGLSTLMIERSENVGEKVISGLTIPIYGFLFGPAFIRDGNPPIERPVDGREAPGSGHHGDDPSGVRGERNREALQRALKFILLGY